MELLAWLAPKAMSGIVTFEHHDFVRALAFENGQLLWASCNRREEQLGAILLRSRVITERALADVVETRAETGVPLGKVLLMSSLVREPLLVEILATKIRETVIDIATWSTGTFELLPRPLPAGTGIAATVAIDAALRIADRRADLLANAILTLGLDDTYFFAPPSAQPPAEPDETLDLGAIWQLASEHQHAAEIVAANFGERTRVLVALAEMVQQQRLVIDRRRRSRTNSAIELAAGARSRLGKGDKAGAFELAQHALHADPTDADVRCAFAATERAYVADLARGMLGKHRVPKRTGTAPLPTHLSELHHELYQRIDGCWDVLSIIRGASAREAEAICALAELTQIGVVQFTDSAMP